jgi:hypothetical protein
MNFGVFQINVCSTNARILYENSILSGTCTKIVNALKDFSQQEGQLTSSKICLQHSTAGSQAVKS